MAGVLMARAYLLPGKQNRGRYHLARRVPRRPGCAAVTLCCGAPIRRPDLSLPRSEVPPEMRCQGAGCATHWPETTPTPPRGEPHG